MKKYSIIAGMLFLSACFVNPEGRVVFYDFSHSKYEVEKKLLDLIHSDNHVPPDAAGEPKGTQGGLERIYVHFNNPDETYIVGFTCDSLDWKTNPRSRLGLIGISDAGSTRFHRDLNSKEEERMQKRFETEILSKLDNEPYTKTNENGSCP